MKEKKKFPAYVLAPLILGFTVGLGVAGWVLIASATTATAEAQPTTIEGQAPIALPVTDQSASTSPVLPPAPSCEFADMIGKPVNQDALVALQRPFRILPPHAAATMDYSAERINVHTDEAGIVLKVDCG